MTILNWKTMRVITCTLKIPAIVPIDEENKNNLNVFGSSNTKI